jgi:DNA modification methylase
VLCDPFCCSGTTLLAGLGHGASKVIGLDKEARYLRAARSKIEEG